MGQRCSIPAPPRRLDEERLELLERGDPASIVAATVHAPVSVESLRSRGLLAPAELEEGLAAVVQAGGWAFSQMWLEETRESVVERLRARAEAEPLEPGLAVAELLPPEPWAPAVLPLLPIERRGGMAYLPGVAASLGARAAAADELGRELEEAGRRRSRSTTPSWRDTSRAEGRLVRLGDGFVVSATAYERARELVVAECTAAGEIALARFRDLAGVGRRDAQLLLERLDQDGITRRLGDRRVLRRAGRVSDDPAPDPDDGKGAEGERQRQEDPGLDSLEQPEPARGVIDGLRVLDDAMAREAGAVDELRRALEA